MRWQISFAVICAALLLPVLSPPSAGASTTDATVRLGAPGPGVRQLLAGPGEPFVVRRARGAPAKGGRDTRRRSLLYFAHLTDPHTVDEMSPGRGFSTRRVRARL